MKQSFQKKIFLSISAFMVILIVVCIGAFSVYTYQNLYRQSQSNLQYISEHTGSEMKTLLENMDNLALYVSTNQDIRTAFNKAATTDYSSSDLEKEVSQTLSSISIPTSSSHYRISLYNRNGIFTSIGIPYNKNFTSKKLSSDDFFSWYQDLPIIRNGASVYAFHSDFWSEKEEKYLSLFRIVFGTTSAFKANAVIEIQCPLSTIESILNFKKSNYVPYLYDKDGTLVYPLSDDSGTSAALYDAALQKAVGNLSKPTSLLYSSQTVRNGFTLVLTQQTAYIWKIILPQILIILLMGIASLMLMIFVIFVITRKATQPLQELTDSVRQVSLSNLSLEMDFSDYPDEISGLNEAFAKMFQRLQQSMDEVVRMQAYEARANMIALQAQMDPHFLYNTLTVIKALSREGNTRQIALTCDYLVKMLRYISSYDEHNISLKQELTHTENYLNLMKIRFEDQFSYSFSIDSNVNTETLLLPRLTLQPLVENCFQHGFKSVAPPWQIQIRFWVEAPRWYVSVTDNGQGVSDEKKQEIMDKIQEFLSHPSDAIMSMKIGGMGLVNTVARLKLKYKDRISFTINNAPEGGTIIMLGGLLEDEYLCD